MNYEEFIEKYIPKTNHLEEDAPYNGYYFETYGEEEKFVKSQDYHHVWTMLECDGFMYMSPGFHHVNRFGYFVCLVPWKDEDEIEDVPVMDQDEIIEELARHTVDDLVERGFSVSKFIKEMEGYANEL